MGVLSKLKQTKGPDPVPKGKLARAKQSWGERPIPELNPSNLVGYNTGIGESRFDDKYYPNLFTDLEDFRSREQHWAEKTAKGLGRVANKTLTELLKIPGYVGGGIAAIGEEIATGGEAQGMDTFVNNFWVQALENYEESVNEDVLPVYMKKSVREGDIWSNLSSIDFWATEGADGLGFMLSMLVPGKAAASLGTGSKLLSKLGKYPMGAQMLSKTDDITKTLTGLESTAEGIDIGIATFTSTMFEAAAEADSAMQGIEQREGESDKEFQYRKAKAGQNVFMTNLAILMGPNAILNRNLFGRMVPNKQLDNFIINEGKITSAIKNKSVLSRVNDYAKIIRDNTLREGFFEEGMQTASEKYFSETDGDYNFNDLFETYLETLGTVEGQKAIVLGSLFGSVAGSVGKGIQDKVNKKRVDDLTNIMSNGIDIFEKSIGGIYKKDKEGNIVMDNDGNPVVDLGTLSDIAAAEGILKERNDALQAAYASGDNITASYLENLLETDLVTSFIRAGEEGITLLEEKLNDYAKGFEGSRYTPDTQKILTTARNAMKDSNFFNTYGTTSLRAPKGKELELQELKSRLHNSYVKNRSSLRNVKSQISELQSDIMRERAELSEELGEENVDSDFLIRKMNADLVSLLDLKKTLTEEYKQLTNTKYQKEQLEALINQREQVEDIQEDLQQTKQENAKAETVEQEKMVNETQLKKESQEQAETVDVKKEVSKSYENLNNLFEESLKRDRSGATKEKGTLTGSKEEDLLKIGEGTETPQGGIQFVGGTTKKEILDIVPEAATALSVTIDPIKHEGNDAYRITLSNIEGNKSVVVSQYNLDEKQQEKDVVSKNEVIDENINNLDQSHDPELNKITARRVEAAVVSEHTGEKASNYANDNKKLVERKDVKLVESQDTMMTSDNFTEFRETPRDKTGETVTFAIGYPGTNEKAAETIMLYDKIQQGHVPTKEEVNDLILYLPIRTYFGENIYTQLFFDNPSGDTQLSTPEYELRKQIVDTMLKGNDISSISAEVAFQFPGWVQNETMNDGTPASNSVLGIPGIDLDNIELLYSNRYGQIMTPLKQPDNDFIGSYVSGKGSIYVKVKAANGKKVPLKLNIRRVNNEEADVILLMTEKLLNPEIELSYNDRINKFPDLMELVQNNLSEDVPSWGLSMDNLTISDLSRHLIYEGTGIKNKYQIHNTKLYFGENVIDFKEFETSKENIKDFLTGAKNRNIIVSKLTQKDYIKRLLDTKTVSTDVKTGEPIFKGNTGIYISPNIKVTGQNVVDGIADQLRSVIKTQRETTVDDIFPESKVQQVVYHGGRKGISQFKKKGDEGYLNSDAQTQNGIYFSSLKEVAATYAENQDEGAVYETKINIQNPYIDKDGTYAGEISDSDLKTLKDQGYDGVIIDISKSIKNYVVFDSNQVQIITSNVIKTNVDNRKIEAVKKKGKKGKDLKNKLRNIKKDSDKDSNTIC